MSGKFAIVSLLAFCVSSIVTVQGDVADKKFLNKQKVVYELFWRVSQPEVVTDLYNVGKNYKMEENLGSYKNETYVREFLNIYKRDMLPRGEIFSVFYPTLLNQAVALFKVFYTAKDFDTLYKTAAWARIHVNEGIFTYAFSVAVYQHPETRHIRIPALHEQYPNLYFNDEVIRQAYEAKACIDPTATSDDEPIIIHANYSKFYQPYHWDEEYKLSYFTEDIPNNEIHYYSQLTHPFWLSAEEFPDAFQSRGDRYFWAYKAQVTRYELELRSNGMGEIKDFDWNHPIQFGYQPSNSYHNGLPFPDRDAYADFPSSNYKWLQELQKWEHSIKTAIDTGFFIDTEGKLQPIRSQEGLKILGNLIEGNANSVNPDVYGDYDKVARKVLGFSPEPLNKYKVFPSMMQHYGLGQRDPIYWSMAKKILGFYERFTSKLPKYTKEELSFPVGESVKIESVDVDEIITFFTPNDYLISGGIKAYGPGDKTVIKARQYRLDHKPYTYTFRVTSDKAMTANIRIFLGSKYHMNHEKTDITENWKNFLFLDEWLVDLQTGSNTFNRSSTASVNTASDEQSGDLFYKKILKAIDGQEIYEIPNQIFAYPRRMVMPRGTKEGLPLQFFVIIIPNTGKTFESKSPLLGDKSFMDLPLGYPLDRPVLSNMTDLPNVYFKEFKVYHKDASKINLTST